MTMTRTTWRTVVGAGIAGLLAVVPAEARSGDSSTSEISGTVKTVDSGKREVTLAGSDGALIVKDGTQILKDGHRATLSDVREGDEVRASYSNSGDTLEVSRLEVVEAPAFNDQG
jgi:Cu/Ag efflux protein CusF